MKLPQLACIFSLLCLLCACSTPLQADTKIGVETSGVNYSDQALTYALFDPKDPASDGGEPIDPFAGGGTMCCYRLPKVWQSGIKVGVKLYDGSLNLIKEEMLDLLPYVDGKPGKLWTVIYSDGSLAVLSSDYGPKHEKWPGKVKGWPVPSIEYRRKLWERDLDLKMHSLDVTKRLIKELLDNPENRLKEGWELDKKYNKNEVKSFFGHDDPAYKKYLMNRYKETLELNQQVLDDWLRRKP